LPGNQAEPKNASWWANALREIRSSSHQNLRRRRLRAVEIDKHHLTEKRRLV